MKEKSKSITLEPSISNNPEYQLITTQEKSDNREKVNTVQIISCSQEEKPKTHHKFSLFLSRMCCCFKPFKVVPDSTQQNND